MKRFLPLLLLVCVGATVYSGETFEIDGIRFNVTVGAGDSSAILQNPYYTVLLRLDSCSTRDAYLFCLNGTDYNPVEHHPYTHEVNLTWSDACGDCQPLGKSCDNESLCEMRAYCVHEICRPTQTWCGDGVCDEGEVCSEDCTEEVEELEEIEENQTLTNISVEVENETNTTNETHTTNETISENITVEATAPPVVDEPPAKKPAPRKQSQKSPMQDTTPIGRFVIITFVFLTLLVGFWEMQERKKKRQRI